jgi:hypothetical protein
MDAHIPDPEDDLSAVERRLADWQPASGSLDADAMLFAAGLAAGRRGPGRLLWPAMCVLLAVQAIGLGMWGLSERAERQALASRLREQAPPPGAPSATAIVVLPQPSYTPGPGDYLSLRRLMERDPNAWLTAPQPADKQAPGPPPPEPTVLRAGQWDGWLEQ